MALNSYVKLKGETQGEIKGSCTKPGREGFLEVNGWAHELVSQVDAASGLPTGKRQHMPLTITKPVDKASPLLMHALINAELLTATLYCDRPTAAGKEDQYYTVTLTNAHIASIRTEQLNNLYPENQMHPIREHVTFTYQEISWTSVEGTSARDEWNPAGR